MRRTGEEGRKAKRFIQNETHCYFNGRKKRFQVFELSANGFSFLSKHGHYFYRGQLIDKIIITNADKAEIIAGAGNILHISEHDMHHDRIGICFTKKTLDNTISGRIRVPRHTPRITLDVSLTFEGKKGNRKLSGKVIDFTAKTARIALSRPKLSDLLNVNEIYVVISSSDYTLFSGLSYIVRRKDDLSEIVVQFIDSYLDIKSIDTRSNAVASKNLLFPSLANIEEKMNIRDDFKGLVCDWRMYLDTLKKVLDQEEHKKVFNSSQEEVLFLQEIEPKVCKDLKMFLDRLNSIADTLNKQESIIYKHYFRDNLRYYIRFSPLAVSMMDKFHGYSGDFETIKQFFRAPYQGETLFGKLLNKFICSTDPIIAHVDRLRFLYEEILSAYNKASNEFRVLNLGCGPALEIIDLVKNNDFTVPLHIGLLDIDAFALTDFCDAVQYHQKKNVTIDLVNFNLLNVIKGKVPLLFKQKFHLSYCAGMLDYFKNNIGKAFVKFLVQHTYPGGTFYITNVHSRNPIRHFMDYAGEWEIIHRTDEELLSLVPLEYKPQLFADKTHTNIYVKGQVPR